MKGWNISRADLKRGAQGIYALYSFSELNDSNSLDLLLPREGIKGWLPLSTYFIIRESYTLSSI